MKRVNLRLTGRIPMPEAVRAAVAKQVISHRSEAFRVLLRRVVGRLSSLLEAEISPMPFTTSGTGGLEAAVVNTIAPGDKVLAVSIGAFGDRFAEIARAFGAAVTPWSIPWGKAADPGELAARVRSLPGLRAVLLTHNESSTGVLNPLPALAAAV